MSILIKGMEMPKPKLTDMATVYNAYVLVRPNGPAAIVVDNEDGLDSTEYPLVHVPPHVDLIDRREAIIDANERAYDFWLSDDEVNASIQFLKEQPTIIPAEEGE